MNRSKLVLCMLALAALAAVPGSSDDESMRAHVEYLASPELEGRFTGSPGAGRAADYLVAQLTEMGAQPLPGQESFKLPIEFTAGVNDAGSWLQAGDERWEGEGAVRALSFSDTSEVTGDVVFAGYGLVVPESQDYAYDSYATLDVTDKVVMVLRYVPEDVDQQTRAIVGRFSGLRHKAMAARQNGAKAILFVTGPNSPNAGETINMSFDTAIAGSGIAAASISGDLAASLLASTGRSLAEIQSELDGGNPHVAGFELPDTEVTVSVAVEREKRTAYNIAGYFPSDSPTADKPFVLLGAHFDHLGFGDHGNSLAKQEEAGQPHVGADDNASGVAVVLAAAGRLAGATLDRHIAVAFWTGEEIGLLGSGRFANQGPLAMEDVAAYLNFDMVGRSDDNKLILQAVGSSPVWSRMIEQSNVPVGFDLILQDDAYLPTDSTAFHQEKVPTLNFFTGSHVDYHRPSDKPETLNYEDLERVSRLGYLIARKLAGLEEAPEFTEVELASDRDTGSGDSVRVFTGTIPDYTSEAEGLMLSGVIEGGPAEQAGLQEGDLVIQLGDQTIANIYDYTYALEAVKIDVTIKVVFMRDGERMESEITPTARQ